MRSRNKIRWTCFTSYYLELLGKLYKLCTYNSNLKVPQTSILDMKNSFSQGNPNVIFLSDSKEGHGQWIFIYSPRSANSSGFFCVKSLIYSASWAWHCNRLMQERKCFLSIFILNQLWLITWPERNKTTVSTNDCIGAQDVFTIRYAFTIRSELPVVALIEIKCPLYSSILNIAWAGQPKSKNQIIINFEKFVQMVFLCSSWPLL